MYEIREIENTSLSFVVSASLKFYNLIQLVLCKVVVWVYGSGNAAVHQI